MMLRLPGAASFSLLLCAVTMVATVVAAHGEPPLTMAEAFRKHALTGRWASRQPPPWYIWFLLLGGLLALGLSYALLFTRTMGNNSWKSTTRPKSVLGVLLGSFGVSCTLAGVSGALFEFVEHWVLLVIVLGIPILVLHTVFQARKVSNKRKAHRMARQAVAPAATATATTSSSSSNSRAAKSSRR